MTIVGERLLAGLAVALIATGSVAGYLYSQNLSQSSIISSQDSKISQLQGSIAGDAASMAAIESALGQKNQSVAQLQAEVTTLNAEEAALSQQIGALQINQTADRKSVAALEFQLSTVRNESAIVQLELAVAGQYKGWFFVSFFVNETWTIAPNSSMLMTSDANGYNGTVILKGEPSSSCNTGGSSSLQGGAQGFSLLTGSQYGFDISGTTMSQTETPAQFFIYVDNTGTTQQTCVLTLLYLYQSTAKY